MPNPTINEKLIIRILAGEFSRKELENLYTNAIREGHDNVQIAAKEQLKQIDTRSYSKRFIKPIRDKVHQIVEEVARENGWGNWADNRVDNRIKAGGPMLNGQELAEYYVSYRHPSWKRSSYFVVFQHDEESAVMYKVKAHDAEEVVLETAEQAIILFKKALQLQQV